MALGMEVGLGPGNIVLHGEQAPLPKGANPPTIFSPFLLWPNGCMHQDTTWYLSQGYVVLDGVAAPPKRGTARSFRLMSAMAKRLE